jgi:hypothetical protein
MIIKNPYKVKPWNSLAGLLDDFTVAELAHTIEREGIYVVDEFGRKVIADKQSTDDRSKKKALEHLADVYSAQQNPGPYSHLESEFDRSDEDPLNKFGWPESNFPEIGIPTKKSTNIDKTRPWKELAVEIAEEHYQTTKKATGSKGRLEDYSTHVEKVFQQESIIGSHGKKLDKNYIEREALQGDKWWKSKK